MLLDVPTANVIKDAQWYTAQVSDTTMSPWKTDTGNKKNYCTLKLNGTVTTDS